MRTCACAFALASIACLPAVAADVYPERPVRLVVPYAAGGGGDTIARLVGAPLSEKWKQNVVVDNRPGGGTVIGTDLVAKSPPDGHTVLINTAAFAINPALLRTLPFDARRDFVPVTQLAVLANLLVVHPSVPAGTAKELIAHARTADLTYGSSGTGTAAHLAGALFAAMANVKMTHVPYKGGAAVMPDILAGRIHMAFATVPSSIAHVRSGKLRALGVASTRRTPALPDVPTIAEAALPGYDASNWMGVFVPAGTPAARVARLQADLAAAIAVPRVNTRLVSMGYEPLANTPGEFATRLAAEFERWQAAVKASGAAAN